MKYTLLTQSILRTMEGAARFPTARRSRWLKFVYERRADDGSFVSHNGLSDFSSTLFGLRTLQLLGALKESETRKTADFLRDSLVALQKGDKRFVTERKNPSGLLGTDLYALVFASQLIEANCGREVFAEAEMDRTQFVLDGFEALHRANGGVSSSVMVRHTSTYNTFIALLTLQIAGIALKRFDPEYYSLLTRFVRNRQQPGGGFVELELIPTIGTVATVSAICIAEIIRRERLSDRAAGEGADESAGEGDGQFTDGAGIDKIYDRSNAHSFLLRMHAAHGGYRAINRIPDATIWSTYMAIVGIGVLGDWSSSFDQSDATLSFLESLYHSNGYVSAAWDTQPDLDSTYYALAVQAVLFG